MSLLWRPLTVALAASFFAVPALQADELLPAGPGPFPVASTNLEVRVPEREPMFAYLNGKVTAQGTLYLTDLLTQPEAALVIEVEVPREARRFGGWAGRRVPHILSILYPTTLENPRAHYAFPYSETGDNLFPHMQRPGDGPIFAEAGAKYPLIVYSGGYNTHGLWHLEHLKALAAHGYVVVDIFHGDGRGSSFLHNLALRTLAFEAALDFVLAHPEFGSAIDVDRIGVSGSSGGAHTILSSMGGFDPAESRTVTGPSRVKAGYGLVPFVGRRMGTWPFQLDAWVFGKDFAGLGTIKVPFLAVYAENDESIAAAGVEAAVRAMAGPAGAVKLSGETHGLSASASADALAWELLFFDAWLRDNLEARQRLERGTSMRGGVTDRVTIRGAGNTP